MRERLKKKMRMRKSFVSDRLKQWNILLQLYVIISYWDKFYRKYYDISGMA